MTVNLIPREVRNIFTELGDIEGLTKQLHPALCTLEKQLADAIDRSKSQKIGSREADFQERSNHHLKRERLKKRGRR